MQLTTNFTLAEFTRSQTAIRRDIDNTPPPEAIENLLRMAEFLQTVRDKLTEAFKRDMPVVINSGYRCPLLNSAIGGSPSSEHVFGRAADIEAPGVTSYGLAEFVRHHMREEPGFNQLIHEFGEWVHVSIPELGFEPKRELLTAVRRNGRTVYEPGLRIVVA